MKLQLCRGLDFALQRRLPWPDWTRLARCRLQADSSEKTCNLCHLPTGKHQCLQFNEQYGDESDLLAHPKKISHFEGRFILPFPSSLVRHLPVPFCHSSEEVALDDAVGSHAIYYDLHDEENFFHIWRTRVARASRKMNL